MKMDAIELLAREDEYKRLNQQLEKKTESLMREIEHVMQKQDFFSEFSPSLSQSHQKVKKHCCTPTSSPDSLTPVKRPIRKKSLNLEQPNSGFEFQTQKERTQTELKTHNDCKMQNRVICDCCPRNNRNEDMEFLYAFVSVNVKDKVLPASFSKGRVSLESVCKFLASKIKLMQEQIDKLQTVIDRKASQCEGHLTQLAEFESERLSLLNRTNNMKSSTADMRAKYMALQKRLEEKDKLYKEQRSMVDKLSLEVKKATSQQTAVEARCASQEQQLQTLLHQLEASRRAEKELRTSTRSLSSSHHAALARLEAQIKSLTSRVDKQASLVDNLRRQNLLLATDGAVKCLERDYCNFLNEDL